MSRRHISISVDRLKRRAIAVGALLAAGAVSVAGVIGFVGLMTPHLLRLVIGADHRRLLPATVLGGAILLILAWKNAGYLGIDRFLLPMFGTPWLQPKLKEERSRATV